MNRRINSHPGYLYLYSIIGCFLTLAMISGVLPANYLPIITPQKYHPYYQGSNNSPKVALACNVFWGEEYIPTMLQTMDNEQIHITFFIGGSWAKRFPHVLKDIANHKHELANHSYSHPHPNSISKTKNQEEILKTQELIQDITDVKTTLYAPPYGEFNETVLIAAGELGYQTIMWSIDTIDWKRPHSEVIKKRVLNKLHNGAIILMHPTEPTAKALPDLIRKIHERGYSIVTVSELLQDLNSEPINCR